MNSNKLMQIGLWLTIANVLSGLLGYVYQILMGRMLVPTDFALFSAITALIMIFGAPLSALSLLVSRRVSNLSAQKGPLLLLRSFYYRTNMIVSFILLVLIGVFTFYIEKVLSYLKSDDLSPLVIFIFAMTVSAFLVVNNAFFHGRKMFGLLSVANLLLNLIKIAISCYLVYSGFGVAGAISGLLFATIIIWCIGWLITIRSLPIDGVSIEVNTEPFPFQTILPVLVATTAFALMTQLDMIFVKHFFSSDEAGMYASVSVLGKAILYLPGGIVLALFPFVSENDANGKSSANILIQSLMITFGLCGSVALVYFFFSDWIILQLFGEKYAEAGALLRWYGLAILPMALILVAEYFLIAKGRVVFAWLFAVATPIQVFAITKFHGELWMIMAIVGVSGTMLCFLGYTFLAFEYLKEKSNSKLHIGKYS